MHPPIAFLTDFGLDDTYVGVMQAVASGIAPGAPLINISHSVPPGDIRHGAFQLWQSHRYFPPGSVFVIVVDPGVGTRRRPVAAAWRDWFFVFPDNGVLSYLLLQEPAREVVELVEPAYRLEDVSTTFHGRDVFSPAGAHLAAGVPLRALGPTADDLITFPPPQLQIVSAGSIRGEVIHVDRFGNLITSIGYLYDDGSQLALESWIPGPTAMRQPYTSQWVRLAGGDPLPVHATFGDAEMGEALAYIGSERLLEIAVNRGSAAAVFEAGLGTEVSLHSEG